MPDAPGNANATTTVLRVVGIVSSIGAVVTCLLAAGVLLWLPGRMATIYEDFDAALPWITLLLLGWPGKVLAGLCILAAAASVAASLLVKDLRTSVLIDILAGMVGVIAVVGCALALIVPMVNLMAGLT